MTEYPLSQHGARELERSRLTLLEECHDPLSRRQLDAIGVEVGWRCLDVGAGGGSVTKMLAERVGATGSVLAIDLDTGLLDALASDRVEVRRQDLLSDALPHGAFDLVHARLLLMFLPSRLEALRRLAHATRPGGWLAATEPDFTTVALSPTNLVWERTWSAFCDTQVASGWDVRYGARLVGDLRAAGLVDVEASYYADRECGGALVPRLLSMTIERMREQMIVVGADGEEIDEAQRLLGDPANTIAGPSRCVARARRGLET